MKTIPPEQRQSVPVFYAVDDLFAPIAAVSMASVLSRTKSHICFYIIDVGISDINRQRLESMKMRFPHAEITFLQPDVQKLFGDFALPHTLPGQARVSHAIYARFVAPELQPELDRIIYLDADTIVLGDIRKLFEENLGDAILGAVPAQRRIRTHEYAEIKQDLGIPARHCYLSPSLLLIDCTRWRNAHITELFLKAAKTLSSRVFGCVQDLFNVVIGKYTGGGVYTIG